MTQLVVTLDDSQPLQSVRKAIGMLKGVLSTAIVPKRETDEAEKQKAYVKMTLTNALKEIEEAEKKGKSLQDIDSFIEELKAEGNGD